MNDPLISAAFCKFCEAATVTPTTLIFIGHDGQWGLIAGVACDRCREHDALPGAAPVIKGRYVELSE
jgi:hypothetical protein